MDNDKNESGYDEYNIMEDDCSDDVYLRIVAPESIYVANSIENIPIQIMPTLQSIHSMNLNKLFEEISDVHSSWSNSMDVCMKGSSTITEKYVNNSSGPHDIETGEIPSLSSRSNGPYIPPLNLSKVNMYEYNDFSSHESVSILRMDSLYEKKTNNEIDEHYINKLNVDLENIMKKNIPNNEMYYQPPGFVSEKNSLSNLFKISNNENNEDHNSISFINHIILSEINDKKYNVKLPGNCNSDHHIISPGANNTMFRHEGDRYTVANSNSPISMSLSGSSSNSDFSKLTFPDEIANHTNDDNNNNGKRMNNGYNYTDPFLKLTYKDIENSLKKYYNSDNYSCELDILITYLKGQKNLFIHSKKITDRRLRMIIIPILFFSGIVTIFAPFMYQFWWSGYFISILNGLVAILVSFKQHLKLDFISGMFLYLSNQYDELQTSLEMTSNKIHFIDSRSEKNTLILNKIKMIEDRIMNIKEGSPVLIHDDVKKIFPIICHINIFSFIQKVEMHKKNLIIKFKDIKNEIRLIYFKWKNTYSMEIESKLSASSGSMQGRIDVIADDLCSHSQSENEYRYPTEERLKLGRKNMNRNTSFDELSNMISNSINGKKSQSLNSDPVTNHDDSHIGSVSRLNNIEKIRIFPIDDQSLQSKSVNIYQSVLDPKKTKYDIEYARQHKRLKFLIEKKEIIKNELLNYKIAYTYIDEIFNSEIKNAEEYKRWTWLSCIFPLKKIEYSYSNPIIEEILQLYG